MRLKALLGAVVVSASGVIAFSSPAQAECRPYHNFAGAQSCTREGFSVRNYTSPYLGGRSGTKITAPNGSSTIRPYRYGTRYGSSY